MQRRRIGERRGPAFELRGALEQGADDFIVEPGADVSGVTQRLALPVAEQQRAQRLARAAAACVAADQKLGRLRRLDFEPGARAPARLVGAVEALGHDALEPVTQGRGEQLLGVLGKMHQLQVLRGQQTLRQVAAPIAVGRGAQVEARKVQQIEAYQHHRRVTLRGGDFRGRLELRPVLQRVERRASGAIEGHDLAIENHLSGRLRGELRRQLREAGRQIQAAARLQAHAAAVHERDHTVAVEFGLIAPLRARPRHLAGFSEHRFEPLRERFGGAGRRQQRGRQSLRRLERRELIEADAGEHGSVARQHVVGLREAVPVLDQQPLVGGSGPHQRERTLELLPAQEKAELACGKARAHPLLGLGAVGE